MRSAQSSYLKKSMLAAAALAAVVCGPLAQSALAITPAQLNLPDPAVSVPEVLVEEPEVKARVARVSFVDGDARIKRSDVGEWEQLTLNLPIVEGDEISTGHNTRVEIQFDLYTHLRLDEDCYLKVARLADSGVAVSLSTGTAQVAARRFDKSISYFEIDAPATTVAIEKAGTYRIDAGREGGDNVAVSVTDGGQARVYTTDSGFTVRNGRRARVFFAGPNEGQWDSDNVAAFADDFDSWARERDAAIARNLERAFYDRYYDRDIYGADDLSNYGEWIYTKRYGYVWRPYRSAISSYSNWSPYRYGHWRWVPPFGWTWINDEPWGWATYHYGRWIWDDGFWVWAPYGYYRYSRSWWSPALVVINVYGGNVCWYPLPYHYAYYDYNYYWYPRGPRRPRSGSGSGSGGPQITPTPTPPGGPTGGVIGPRPKGDIRPPLSDVPPGAVVEVSASDFGTTKKGIRQAPLAAATAILSKVPEDQPAAPLPTISDVRNKLGRDIRSAAPPLAASVPEIKVGAAVRPQDAPLDSELREKRIFGGRPPLQPTDDSVKTGQGAGPRPTGAVGRPEVKSEDGQAPGPVRPPRGRPIEQPGNGTKDNDGPIFQNPRPTYQPPVKEEPRYDVPRNEGPRPRPQPRFDPPPVKEPSPPEPRPQPQPRFENPRPTYEPPPPRPQPQPDPPRKADPPPSKDGTKDG
jgi:hypothetical protein